MAKIGNFRTPKNLATDRREKILKIDFRESISFNGVKKLIVQNFYFDRRNWKNKKNQPKYKYFVFRFRKSEQKKRRFVESDNLHQATISTDEKLWSETIQVLMKLQKII